MPQPARKNLIDIKSGARAPSYRASESIIEGREKRMSSPLTSPIDPAADEVPEEPVPAMQHLLDNPFLLLFIGVAMPTVLYIIWGVMEIVGLPIAK